MEEELLLSYTITGQTGIDLIIPKPIPEEEGPNLLFMEDNTSSHRTESVRDLLREGKIERMEWPPLSADVNPPIL